MKKLFFLTLALPLLLGACGDDPAETSEPGGQPGKDPVTTSPAGTKEDPAHVADLDKFIGRTGIWVEGYVAGTDTPDVPQDSEVETPRDNVLLADAAEVAATAETPAMPLTARVMLDEGSDIQARLNLADHPDLVGEKVMVKGDVSLVGGRFHISAVTDLVGGREPVVDPDPKPDPEPVDPPVTGNVELDRLYGYAEGTTGGAGAAATHIHHFNDGAKFGAWLKLREKNKDTTPAIVYLSGTFTKDQGRGSGSPWFDIKRTSNISIYGVDGFIMQNVGFFLNEAANIIIRNIHIRMPKADNGADGISMQESHNVWVDHCTFESMNQTHDYEDGSCDITHQSYNVTVSWCHFIKTQKSCLVGHSNSQTADASITVTFHHNFFDLSSSRHPRVRFGHAHVYNNFYNQVTTYGAGSAYGAVVLVEDNLFDGVRLPTDICTFPAKPSGSSWVSNLQGSEAGFLYARGNEYLNKPADATEPYPLVNVEYKAYNGEKLSSALTYEDFKPSYDYIVDPAAELATIVPSASGVGKLRGYDAAPIEADNGGMPDTGDPTDPDNPDDPDPTPTTKPLGNGWTAVSCGAASATASGEGNTLTLTACGKFESGAQSFGYVYREVTGDFVATVRVDSFESQKTSGNQSLAGIMLTPDFAATANDFLHAMAAQGPAGYHHSSRVATDAAAARGNLTAPTTDTGAKVILKLEREGDKCKLSYSLDGGATFGSVSSKTIEGLPDKVYVGLAANSGDSKKTSTEVFSDFTLDGTAIGFSAAE